MAEEKAIETETETPEVTEAADRRGFLRSALVGVAGATTLVATVGSALADTAPAKPAPTPTRPAPTPVKPAPTPAKPPAAGARPVAPKLTAAEKIKDDKRIKAEALLRELGDDVEVQWVKGNTPGARRIIQLKG